MAEHAASAKDVEHGVEGKRGVVKPFSSAGVTEKLEGLGGVTVAEADAFQDLVDYVVGEENAA